MLIEPTPALPPSRGGRARLLAAIAAPLMLLVAAVGSGTVGQALAPDAPAIDSLASVAVPTVLATPTGTADPQAFPSRMLGLPTRTVEATLELRRAGRIGDEVVAIRGWLTLSPAPAECRVQPEGLCARRTILTDVPDTVSMRGTVHLHPTALPGVGLPDPGDRSPVPFPVVLLGRFDDPRLADPRTRPRHPNEAFALERVAWAVGIHAQVRVVAGSAKAWEGLDARAVRAIVSAALPSGTVVLSQAVVDIDMLKRLDPTASGLARREADQRGLELPAAAWYVRVMIRDGPPVDTLAGDTAPRRIGFAVVTVDGTVLAAAAED